MAAAGIRGLQRESSEASYPRNDSAVEAGEPGVVIGDLLLHDPSAERQVTTIRPRRGVSESHRWASGMDASHIQAWPTEGEAPSPPSPACQEIVQGSPSLGDEHPGSLSLMGDGNIWGCLA